MNSKFIKTCYKLEDYPEESSNEIILLGRSNVGKSSFINALCNKKNLAYTSSTPGMTRGMNFYQTDGFILVDAPGYGYQAKNKGEYQSFYKITDEYFSKRKTLKMGLLLLDVRREANQDDIDMMKYIQSKHLALIVILTKCDKVSNNVIFNAKKSISSQLGIREEVIYPTSATNKTGYDKVLEKILETVK